MQNFILYGRPECHLCDALQNELEALQSEHRFSFDWVDVDEEAALELKYGFFVPVLMYEGHKVCHYYLDQEALLKILS